MNIVAVHCGGFHWNRLHIRIYRWGPSHKKNEGQQIVNVKKCKHKIYYKAHLLVKDNTDYCKWLINMGSQTENERTVVSSDAIEADQTKEFENSETRDAVGRGEEGILEGVVIGNDEEVDVWDDAESDDEDEGIIIVTDLVNTQRAAANAKRRYERGSNSYVRPELPKDITSKADDSSEVKNDNNADQENESGLSSAELKALRFPFNKSAFDVDLDSMTDQHPAWRNNRVDLSNYFNYGFNEATWKVYCGKQLKLRAAKGEGPVETAPGAALMSGPAVVLAADSSKTSVNETTAPATTVVSSASPSPYGPSGASALHQPNPGNAQPSPYGPASGTSVAPRMPMPDPPRPFPPGNSYSRPPSGGMGMAMPPPPTMQPGSRPMYPYPGQQTASQPYAPRPPMQQQYQQSSQQPQQQNVYYQNHLTSSNYQPNSNSAPPTTNVSYYRKRNHDEFNRY